MQSLLSVLFYIRKSKNKNATKAAIYLRITYMGQRSETSISRKVSIYKWNSKANRLDGYSHEAKQTNRYLDIIRNQVYDIYQRLVEKEESITANLIKDIYLGHHDLNRTILKMFDEHNHKMKKLVGKEYSFRTLQRYETTKSHLEKFLIEYYKVSDYLAKKVDVQFINSFIYYLKTEKDLSHNSALKYVAYLKKIIRIAVANGWIEKDPFYNFKIKTQRIEKEFLSQYELVQIIEKEFSISRLKLVRDVFIFCCYTGLSYSDVLKLTIKDIVKGIDGSNWINIKRTKTNSISKIPILPIAQNLIDNYSDNEIDKSIIFPVFSNQKMNGYLKEIADLCKINKHLTFHMARHTFATTITLSNGVPLESVSKMLGHQSIKTTQHYAKILDIKLSEDMDILKRRLTSTK